MPVPQARRLARPGVFFLGFLGVFALAFGVALANGLSSADQYRLKRAMAFAVEDDWPAFERKAGEVENSLARRYLTWRRLLSAGSEFDWRTVIDFANRHPNWPRTGELQAVAERLLGPEVDFDTRRQFFATRQPLTKEGKLALAEALLDSGDVDEVARLIRQAWIEEDFGTSEIRRIRALFGGYLRHQDHIARLDRLLWSEQWTSARRMLQSVDNRHRALAEARLKLQRFHRGVDSAIRAVPTDLRRDPGLEFDRLHWRRRKGKTEGVRAILLDPPDELGRPQAWWYERKRQIRDRLDRRRFHEAARLAKAHRQQSGLAFAEAEWLAGWLSLRYLDEPKTALSRFENIFDAVRSPISRARAAYWSGRAAAAAGSAEKARNWYRLAAGHPTTFYGQEAAHELSMPVSVQGGDPPNAGFPEVWQEIADVASMLCEVDEGDAAVPFLRHLSLEPELAAPAMNLARRCGRPDLVVELAKFGIRAGVADPLWSYPVITEIRDAVEPEARALTLAVSRQESHFEVRARSGAGAEGLMQLMPATAKAIGRRERIRFAPNQVRRDPSLNLRLGTAYLERLIERYDGHLAMVAAAYNAGPSRVSQWVKRHGDPRRMDRFAQIDWIELIAFSETRNYVQRVIEGRNVYEAILSRDSGFEMGLHKTRGGLIPALMPKPNPRRRSQ